MTRQFGLSRRQDSIGGFGNPAGSRRAVTPRDSIIPFPSGSYRSADETFEPLKVPPSLFEIAGLVCTLFFGCALGVSFFAVLYVLFLSPL